MNKKQITLFISAMTSLVLVPFVVEVGIGWLVWALVAISVIAFSMLILSREIV